MSKDNLPDDFFGIGSTLRTMVVTYGQIARSTGRTTRLVDSLKPGDRVICASEKEQHHLRSKIAERAAEARCADPTMGIEVRVLKPSMDPRDAMGWMGTRQGRTIFEHTWVELHYEAMLHNTAEVIAFAEKAMSGYGEDHRRTARKAGREAEYVRRNGGMDFRD